MTRPNRSTWVLAASILGCAACDDGGHPLGPGDPLTRSLAAEAVCYGVSGTIVETFQGADLPNNLFFFGGPVSGDLIGTSFSALTGPGDAPGDPPSPINGGLGTHTLEVTGGAIDVLVGKTLVFDSESVNRQDPPLAVSHDRWTLVSGARRGHLTLHGAFDFTTFTSTAQYRGTICP